MKRRDFFRRFGSGAAMVVAAPALALVAKADASATADEFEHNGYRVKWRDYVQPANQNVLCGVWFAKHDTVDQEWASTTLGQCYPTRAWEVLDMARADGWPMLTGFSTDAELADAKERARLALLEVLTEVVSPEDEDDSSSDATVAVEAPRRSFFDSSLDWK